MRQNITTIGGGGGTFNLLLGLKKNRDLNISALITMADDGGSAGELRDEFWILPPGDVRRALVALSADTNAVRRLFEYRFKKESRLANHTIWNLLLTALADIHGDFEMAINELGGMFDTCGRVIPSTLSDIRLWVELENGEKIIGESRIDVRETREKNEIRKAFLVGDAVINPRAFEAIQNADYIVIGPGDLYTSIVPNLLVPGICEAIAASSARVIYICNIMTKHGETDDFSVQDFVRVVESYIGSGVIDSVVVNNGWIDEGLLEKYWSEEKKRPVKITDVSTFVNKSYKIIERDLVNDQDYIRHHPDKLWAVMRDFTEGWIK